MRILTPSARKPATEFGSHLRVPLDPRASGLFCRGAKRWRSGWARRHGADEGWPTGRERGGGGYSSYRAGLWGAAGRRRGLESGAFVGNSLAGHGLWGSLTPMTHRRRTQPPDGSPRPSGPALDVASVEAVARRVVELLRAERHSPRESSACRCGDTRRRVGCRAFVGLHPPSRTRRHSARGRLKAAPALRRGHRPGVACRLYKQGVATPQHPWLRAVSSRRRRQRMGSSADLLPIRGASNGHRRRPGALVTMTLLTLGRAILLLDLGYRVGELVKIGAERAAGSAGRCAASGRLRRPPSTCDTYVAPTLDTSGELPPA